MQTNTNVVRTQKPIRSKSNDEMLKRKDSKKRERDSQRANKRIFAFA